MPSLTEENMQINDENVITGFLVSGQSRDRYHFDSSLLSANGKAAIPSFHAARLFAQQVNQNRNLIASPESAVSAGQINAMALIHGISLYIFRLFCQQHGPDYLQQALTWLQGQSGAAAVNE